MRPPGSPFSGRLWQRLRAALGDKVTLTGHPTQHLPNTRNVSFLGHGGAVRLRVGRFTADRETD